MTEKSIVGIDFGTSTSVVRVKNYSVEKKNGSEIWRSFDRNEMMAYNVTFNSGQVIVPTIIQKVNNINADNISYFGYDAAVHKKGETLYQNFKVELEGPQSESARELTQEYLRYLCQTYRTQREGGYLGSPSAEEKTIISYPVKWSEETRDFMLEAAKKAGFKNVEGMDEAEAAITAVTAISSDMLKQRKYIERDKPVNIMLIDMGAGTTDIVICRYTPGEKPKNEILCTWPNEGEILFGGRELDEILHQYILEKTPEDGKSLIQRKVSVNEYKAWKENTVSGCLQRNESVTYFSYAASILDVLDMDLDEFSLDRAVFEEYARDYLEQFPKLVNGSIQACIDGGMLGSGSDIDLVILTGGHSCWYFVKDMLLGEGDKICLEKIKADNNRLISIAKPQETVALGLVYSKLPQFSAVKESARPRSAPKPAPSQPMPDNTDGKTPDKQDKAGDLRCPSCGEPFGPPYYQLFCYNCGTKRTVCVGKEVTVSGYPLNVGYEQNGFFGIVKNEAKASSFCTPTNNLYAMQNAFYIPDHIKIYCTHDTSLFRRGKSGLVMCTDSIRVSFGFGVVKEFSWAEFMLAREFTMLQMKDVSTSAVNDSFLTALHDKLKKTGYYRRLIQQLTEQNDNGAFFCYPVRIESQNLDKELHKFLEFN